jgi:hypothetical protein
MTPAMVATVLANAGYAAETGRLTAEARKFPGTWAYTVDRHRAVVHHMPRDDWEVADCAASEERIKALRSGR